MRPPERRVVGCGALPLMVRLCARPQKRAPARKHAKEKRSDTCRYRTSLVRLVRLMRVGESHVLLYKDKLKFTIHQIFYNIFSN